MAIMDTRTIETERLLLRPFRSDDLDLIKALYCDGEILRYAPFDVMTDTQAEAHLANIIGDWDRTPLRSLEFAMVSRSDGAGIGRSHILIDPETDTGMIGWFLRKEYWGIYTLMTFFRVRSTSTPCLGNRRLCSRISGLMREDALAMAPMASSSPASTR